jgi:hypothetical protein
VDPINFECVKVSLRQNKEGFMLTLAIVQTAGILAKDPEFQRWCVDTGWCFSHSEDDAARAICEALNIESRSELASNTEAQGALIDLRKEFEEWKRSTNES